MRVSSAFILSVVVLASAQALAQKGGGGGSALPRQVYLQCTQPDEPAGVMDIHIDFEKKVITDAFATPRPFREDGPFLIAESFVDQAGQAVKTSTLRVNRYTFAYELIYPQLAMYQRIQCIPVERKM